MLAARDSGPADAVVGRAAGDLRDDAARGGPADRARRPRPDPGLAAPRGRRAAHPGRPGVVLARDRELGRPVVPPDRLSRLPLAPAREGRCRPAERLGVLPALPGPGPAGDDARPVLR